jgi:hypothetical protein
MSEFCRDKAKMINIKSRGNEKKTKKNCNKTQEETKKPKEETWGLAP